jgi:glycosyltransferase involved in cell wall biosynthesis
MNAPSPRLLHVTTSDMSLDLLLGPQLQAFKAAGYEVHTASAAGPHVAALTAAGIVHHPLRHATRSTALHHDVLAVAELYRLFRSVRPDIVHTHNPKPGVYGRITARAAGVPLVINTQHGLYAQPTDRIRRRLPVYGLERVAAAFGDVELVQNEEDVETLGRLRVPAGKLRLLGNGIDLERFRSDPEARAEMRRELGVGDSQLIVGTIGRLVREKGVGDFLDAARSVLERRDDVVFVVVGPEDPDKGDAISREEIDRATAAGVRFLGYREDPERLYPAFDVFVLASWREGFPRAAMEASASGTPVVATDIRGCRQVVDDGATGLLVPPNDPPALATAITTMLVDRDRRAAMGTAAIARAQQEFDQQRCIDRTLAAYELLATPRRARRARGRRDRNPDHRATAPRDGRAGAT